MKQFIALLLLLLFANANEKFYYQKDKKIQLTHIQTSQKLQKRDANKTIDYYKTDEGQIVGVSEEIIVKVSDEKTLNKLIEKYPITLKKKLTNRLYVVETNSTQHTLKITNKLYEEINVSYAHPNFIKRIDKR